MHSLCLIKYVYVIFCVYVRTAVVPINLGVVDQLAASLEQLSLEEGIKNYELIKLKWLDAMEAEKSKIVADNLMSEKVSSTLSLDKASRRMVAHLPDYQKQWIKSKPITLMTRHEIDWLFDHEGGRIAASRSPTPIESWLMEFWRLSFNDAIKINSAKTFHEFAVGFFKTNPNPSNIQKTFLLHYFSADHSETGNLIFQDLVIQKVFENTRGV